jgi:hypothetical protein
MCVDRAIRDGSGYRFAANDNTMCFARVTRRRLGTRHAVGHGPTGSTTCKE